MKPKPYRLGGCLRQPSARPPAYPPVWFGRRGGRRRSCCWCLNLFQYVGILVHGYVVVHSSLDALRTTHTQAKTTNPQHAKQKASKSDEKGVRSRRSVVLQVLLTPA